MTAPCVSFVVPTYKLASLLGECLRSILAQSFRDYEVLVMDDCSPDDSQSVAYSFADPRIRHVRNETNLGHLANYNKGIRLARGRYIWLLSADDRLRSSDVLSKFVAALDSDPNVTFAFCPAMGLRDGVETGIVQFCWNPPEAMVLEGPDLLRILLRNNVIAAPTCLVRTTAYHAAGLFPLDLPYAGDWYLWCRFALQGRVAYFPEPMVHYRLHAQSMTESLSSDRPQQIEHDETLVRWRIMHEASAAGASAVRRMAADEITRHYSARVTAMPPPRDSLSLEAARASIAAHAASPREAGRFIARVCEEAGDALWSRGRFDAARAHYLDAIRSSPPALRALLKRSLLGLGGTGSRARSAAAAIRDALVTGARR